jgi:hypothetical protein
LSSTLEQIREFTTLGEARAFAVEMMDCGHLVDVRQQAVYRYLVFLDDALRFATGFSIFSNRQPPAKAA